MRRHVTTAALIALVVAGFGLLAAVLLPASAGAVTRTEAPTPAVSPVDAPALPGGAGAQAAAPAAPDAFLVALVGPATDLPAGQADALTAAADRVCEGLTAGVPVAEMSATLMAELSLSGEEAMHLVNTAAATRCR